MNNQYCQPPPCRIGLFERGCYPGVTIAIKVVIGIHHPVIVLRFVQHRILAARRNDHVFHAVAVKITEHYGQFGQQRELPAKLLLHEFVIHFGSRRPNLPESWNQHHYTERQEERYFSHGSTLVPRCHHRQVTKVTTRCLRKNSVDWRPAPNGASDFEAFRHRYSDALIRNLKITRLENYQIQNYEFPLKCSHPRALSGRTLPSAPISRIRADFVIRP